MIESICIPCVNCGVMTDIEFNYKGTLNRFAMTLGVKWSAYLKYTGSVRFEVHANGRIVGVAEVDIGQNESVVTIPFRVYDGGRITLLVENLTNTNDIAITHKSIHAIT